MTEVDHRCAVLGKPIAHSLSPVLHNAAYRALGLDSWSYGRHEVGETELEDFLESLDSSWAGLSLTMPLKKTIQPYGVPCNAWAKELKVANTAVFDWSGANDKNAAIPAIRLYNTDVKGIELAFEHSYRARGMRMDSGQDGEAMATPPPRLWRPAPRCPTLDMSPSWHAIPIRTRRLNHWRKAIWASAP